MYMTNETDKLNSNSPSFKVISSFTHIASYSGNGNKDLIDLTINFNIENTSLSWVSKYCIGILYFQYYHNNNSYYDDHIPMIVELCVDIDKSQGTHSDKRVLKYYTFKHQAQIINKNELPPMSNHNITFKLNEIDPNNVPWQAAIYVIPEGYSPSWFQFEIDEELMKKIYYNNRNKFLKSPKNLLLPQVTKPKVSVKSPE